MDRFSRADTRTGSLSPVVYGNGNPPFRENEIAIENGQCLTVMRGYDPRGAV